MNIDEFTETQRTYLTKTSRGAWAFVPPPLPPRIDIARIALELSAASKAVGELRGAARRLQNPYMLIMPLIRKEALTSSAIEGTITTIDDMLIEHVSPPSLSDDNAREAHNYVIALSEATKTLEKLPISHRVITEAHRTLLSGLSPARGAGKRPGEYKNSQNAIGKTGDDETTARYVPTPPAQAIDCMTQLEAFINRQNRRAGEELLDIGLVHYQFEAIHPFSDGNGRIGRMLVTLMAQQLKLVDHPLVHISAEIETDKPGYIDRLFAVSSKGNWEDWLAFFLRTVQRSCMAATAKVDQIIGLQQELRERALGHRNNHRLAAIVDRLFTREWITVKEAQEICGVSFPTAQADIESLVHAGILTPMKKARPAVYVATEIWRLGDRS